MIDDRLPPPALRRALDRVTSGVRVSELKEAARRLSETYRGGTDPRSPTSPSTELDRLAYVGARMPATYRATRAVLEEFRSRCPGVPVASLLDIGAGPGTSLWAAGSVFDELARVTLLEPNVGMVTLAQRLWAGSSLESRVKVTWRTGGAEQVPSAGDHDLVVVAYLLAELGEDERRAVVDAAWDVCEGAAVFIEPGSVDGFRHVIEARQRLLDLGASVVAPCPHERPCPLPPDDWCHFAARLNRTPLQRQLKGGVLTYEDEKYAYVVATRGLGGRSAARVIRRPHLGAGYVTVQVCARDGLRELTVTRSQRKGYRRARKVRWGDSWDQPLEPL